MGRVIPTVLSFNKRVFLARLGKLVKISDEIQIDFMDKKFVPTKSVDLKDVPSLKKYRNVFEAHLMVKNPQDWINGLKEKGFARAIFHLEALKNDEERKSLIRKVKRAGMEPMIAINPGTRVERVYPFIGLVKKVLFLGVNPGMEHQKFKLKVYNKIRKLREKDKKVVIQVDGGVNPFVAKKLRLLGVNIINSGSFISSNRDPERALALMAKSFN